MVTLQELHDQLVELMKSVDPSSTVQFLTKTGSLKPIEHVAFNPMYGSYIKEGKRK